MRRHVVALLSVTVLAVAIDLNPALVLAAGLNGPTPVELEVDFRSDQPTYFTGGPLPFALRVKLLPRVDQVTLGSDWYSRARVEFKSSDEKTWKRVAFRETAATPRTEPNATITLVPNKRGNSAYLVVPPQATESLPAGSYELRASVDLSVRLSDGSRTNVALEHSTAFEIAAVETSAQKSRFSEMLSTYQAETEKDFAAAAKTLEAGLRESGNTELNHRLGWLYQSRGDLEEAIAKYRLYIAWVRISGAPREPLRRGPQDIADELETVVIPILQRRIAERRHGDHKSQAEDLPVPKR